MKDEPHILVPSWHKGHRTLCGEQDGWKYIKTLKRSSLLLVAHTTLAARKDPVHCIQTEASTHFNISCGSWSEIN
jgi:hypothetical protein